MSDADIQLLSELAKIKNVKRAESVYMSDGFDSRIYLVLKGKVKVSEVDDRGDELIKEVLSVGDVFGDVSLDGNMAEDEFAEALTENTVICSFRSADFRKLIQQNSVLALNYAQQVCGKLRRMESKHANLVFKDAKARLIGFFRDWAIKEGDRKGNKIVLDNYLTHNDIAGIISTSRQSVTTLLNELRDCGMLLYNRKTIEIDDSNWMRLSA